ncbi:hypothetical protein BHE74_00034076 [Ensete ventricosum]|nr:hypothetical protein BHE74_00034076 [Ensete ventricosum]RZS29212.1 hypothetical protein BHM03_00062918 [Ensete ventricosum]
MLLLPSSTDTTITANLPPTFPPSSATFSPHSRSCRRYCLPLPDATIAVTASDCLICCSASCYLPALLPNVALDRPHLSLVANATMLPTAVGINTTPSVADIPFPYHCHLLHLHRRHCYCPPSLSLSPTLLPSSTYAATSGTYCKHSSTSSEEADQRNLNMEKVLILRETNMRSVIMGRTQDTHA